jgi:hypothetical protein
VWKIVGLSPGRVKPKTTFVMCCFSVRWPIYCGLILIDIKSVRSISHDFCCIKSNGLLTNRLILLLSSQLTTSINWPCYCTVLLLQSRISNVSGRGPPYPSPSRTLAFGSCLRHSTLHLLCKLRLLLQFFLRTLQL